MKTSSLSLQSGLAALACGSMMLLAGAGCTLGSMSLPQSTDQTYTNTDLGFSVNYPVDATVNGSFGAPDERYHNLGSVLFAPAGNSSATTGYGTLEHAPKGDVLITTYSDSTWLEKAHSSNSRGNHDDFLDAQTRSDRLVISTATIANSTAYVFAGTSVGSGVGDTSYPTTRVEVIGPTYSYWIEFFGYSDVNDPYVQTYLSSFKAL